MRLRAKLALTAAVFAVPLVSGYLWWRSSNFLRLGTAYVRDAVEARMLAGGREACEADPARFTLLVTASRAAAEDEHPFASPGRSRPLASAIRVYAYGPDFASANRAAPEFPEGLRAALEAGEVTATRRVTSGREDALEVGLATAWRGGPCAFLLARSPAPLASATDRRNLLSAAAICGALLVVMLVAAGPPVSRIRRLTAAVGRAAASRYAAPVEVSGDDEIAELARAFNAAGAELRALAARAERREETLRAHVEVTTHDAATPLTVLQSHLGALRRQLESGEAARPELVLSSLDEAHYMTSLLQNLGASARLASLEAMDRAAIDVGRLVQRVVARLSTVAKQRGVTLDAVLPGEAVIVAGDETLLEQAVSNVVQNAVLYAEKGGSAVVLVGEGGGGGAPATFFVRVIDDGPGVPEEDLPRILERSYRGRSARSRNPGGLGLGLSITRDIVARHGFALDLRRGEEGGLAVEIRGEKAGG